MPWREQTTMSQREAFVLRALEPHANLSELCREFGISRKTAYKWKERFAERGVVGLEDLSRRPHHCPVRVEGEVVLRILELRAAHRRWGPKKLRHLLTREFAADAVPSVRTVARVLERAGEVERRRAPTPTNAPTDAPKVDVAAPNDLWTVDFKGAWHTRNGMRAEPLTVRDAFSRFVLTAELLDTNRTEPVRAVFVRLFEQHGLPRAIQVDNGTPFIAMKAPAGLTRLSAWWVSLGIRVVRGRPGHPQDNGGHERMHLDVADEVERTPAEDNAATTRALTLWRHEFNHVRPHEALDMRTPAEVYVRSTRRYTGPKRCVYAPGVTARPVSNRGYVKFGGRAYYVGLGLVGQVLGLCGGDDGVITAHLYDVDLGAFRATA